MALGIGGATRSGARLWLAVAVATLWLLSVGVEWPRTTSRGTLLDDGAVPGRPRTRWATCPVAGERARCYSWVALLVALLRQELLPEGHFVPEPWNACTAWADETCEPQMSAGGRLRRSGSAGGGVSGKKTIHINTLCENLPLWPPGPGASELE